MQRILNASVYILVWGPDSYEIANFTGDELVPALIDLATEQGHPHADRAGWQRHVQAAVS